MVDRRIKLRTVRATASDVLQMKEMENFGLKNKWKRQSSNQHRPLTVGRRRLLLEARKDGRVLMGKGSTTDKLEAWKNVQASVLHDLGSGALGKKLFLKLHRWET